MKRHYCPTCGALPNPLAFTGRKDQKKRVLYCEYCIETNKPPELYTKTVEEQGEEPVGESAEVGWLDKRKG